MQNYANGRVLGWKAPVLPETLAARTRRVYDRLACVYPASTFLFHSHAHRVALESAGIRDGMQVLEVATGSGEMFRRLVRANPAGITVGIDVSPNMAARTQRRARKQSPHSRAHCQAVDARHMPFRDSVFDAVLCCYLLELLGAEDISPALSEFRRVLRPGGTVTLVLIGQNAGYFNRIYRVLGSLVPAFWGCQVERMAAELVAAHHFRLESDRHVRQNGYPSRILTARK